MNTGIPCMTCGPVNRRSFTGVRDRVRQANLRHGTMGEARPEVSLSCVRSPAVCPHNIPPVGSRSHPDQSWPTVPIPLEHFITFIQVLCCGPISFEHGIRMVKNFILDTCLVNGMCQCFVSRLDK